MHLKLRIATMEVIDHSPSIQASKATVTDTSMVAIVVGTFATIAN